MKVLIPVILVLLLIFAAKAYYDTNSIEVRYYQIGNSSLGEVLSGLKVAHLSDLHIKTIGLTETKILEILKEGKPDLIFITGDLISFQGPYEPVMSFFYQLKPRLGVYAVLGNTEYSNENGSCTLCHEERSKRLKKRQTPFFLRNSCIPLRINGKTLNIVGVDDPVHKKSDLRRALKGANPGHPSILLAHSPEIFDEASGLGIDFLFSGHTHGGQIFLTKYLRKIFPLEASLEFIEGFFQKGKMLMYVSQGVGTSYLPFRLGVKPQITFFHFDNPGDSSNVVGQFAIKNNAPSVLFSGFSFGSFLETFDVFRLFGHSRSPINTTNSMNLMNQSTSVHSAHSTILYDFESEYDLKRLDWECHKWFELSEKHVTSGKHSLKVVLPSGQYPGIDFEDIKEDWSNSTDLRMDVFNPSEEILKFHVRIDDNASGWEYADRFDINFELKQGANCVSISTNSIKTNIHDRPLNLKRIRRVMVFIPNNRLKRELYIDNIRLERLIEENDRPTAAPSTLGSKRNR